MKEAFLDLKVNVSKTPCSIIFRRRQPLIVENDASSISPENVLSQKEKGKQNAIKFATISMNAWR